MAVINEKIAELRKKAGLTQEQLSDMIGVSAQAISKWENSTNMPDVMLLPIIADVFGVTIDELYGICRSSDIKPEKYNQYNAPELAWESILETLGKIWEGTGDWEYGKFVPELKKQFEDERAQTLICSDTGGAVLAFSDIGLVIKKVSRDVFSCDAASEFLSGLSKPAVRKLLLYNYENRNAVYTAPAIAKKCGISVDEALEALNFLAKHSIVKKSALDVGDEKIDVFTPLDFLVYVKLAAIMMLAEKIIGGNYYYGAIGSLSWMK